ncbi:unnamed protein product [Somion occarium]|uniref:Polysaccharide lyase 14 domain-containing protein n=1 Tax=Somion occarium TaxID=3059160 RepID=A0ABP1D8R1_9APHY
MFVFKTLVTVIAFSLSSVSAAPHGLRGRCKHTGKGTVSASAAPAEATTTDATSTSSASVATPSVSSSVVSISSSAPSPSSSAAASSAAAPSASASSSSSSSASKPASSSSAVPAPAHTFASSVLNALLPVSRNVFWSTAQEAPEARPLSDSTFRPTRMIQDLAHNYVDHEGKKAMQAHYPKGSYTFTHSPKGGISFYAPGPSDIDLTSAKEVTLGYSVFFEDGFEFVKGGKLPGLYGGDSDDEAISCSGGRRDDGCFSARMMWRTDGAGELYTYLPPSAAANKAVCNVKPLSTCNDDYGASVGRGAFTWKTGQWSTISQRVRLNDPGQSNGELELFYEGQSVINVGGLVLRDKDVGRIRGIQMQTFFGGSDSSWASPKDQDVFFADFSVAVTQKL